MSARLRLSRSFRIMSGTKFKIMLDGNPVGTIANDASTEISVDAGTHTMQLLAVLRLTSPTRTFTVGDGDTADFVCHARGPFFLFTPWFIASMLFRHSWWIVLKPAPREALVDHDNAAAPSRSAVPTA